MFKVNMNCGSCIHKNVCKFKDNSKNMVEEIEQTEFSIDGKSLIKIFDIHELIVSVSCSFYFESKEAR